MSSKAHGSTLTLVTEQHTNGQGAPAIEWDPPLPLDQHNDVPEFPVDALPEPFGSYITAEAISKQVPTALVGNAVLGTLSTALLGRINVEIKPDWREQTNLYLMTVLPSGHRKSAVMESTGNPLRQWEQEINERLAEERGRSRARGKALTAALKEAEKAVADAQAAYDDIPDGDKQKRGAFDNLQAAITNAGRAETALAQFRPFFPVKLFIDDTTPEAATRELLKQPTEAISIHAAEGDVIAVLAGRYSSGSSANLGVFLRGHPGDEYRVDRVEKTMVIHNPRITMTIAVQPQVLQSITSRNDMKGLGFLARFLYAIPNSRLGHRDIDAPSITPALKAAYASSLKGIADHMWGLFERYRQQHPDTPDNWYVTLRPTPEAQALFRDAEAAAERRLLPGGDFEGIEDWGSKHLGATARLAGIICVARHGGDINLTTTISAEDAANAIRIAEYFLAHSKVALRSAKETEAKQQARDILRRLNSDLTADGYWVRELERAFSVTKASEYQYWWDGLDLLVSLGYLMVDPNPKPRPGPASRHYLVNPHLRRGKQDPQ